MPSQTISSNTTSSRRAPSPFNKRTEDVVLRSSDGVDFFVRKASLQRASVMFDGMLSVSPFPGDPGRRHKDDQYIDDCPIIPITETADVLEVLARFCHADLPHRALEKDIDPVLLCKAMQASRKYMMEGLSKQLFRMWQGHVFIKGDPLDLYFLSYKFGLYPENKVAAQACIKGSFPFPTQYDHPLMRDADVGHAAYSRLLAYRERCRAAGLAILRPEISGNPPHKSWRWEGWYTASIGNLPCWCLHDPPSDSEDPNPPELTVAMILPSHVDEFLEFPPPWWVEWMEDLAISFSNQPSADCILFSGTQDIIDEAIAHCSQCSMYGEDDIKALQLALGGHIEKILNAIELD